MRMHTALTAIIFCLLFGLFSCRAGAADMPGKGSAKTMSVKDMPGKLPRKTGPPTIRIDRGYCCISGSVQVANEQQCSDKRGRYFSSEAEAKKNCPGACCIDGVVETLPAKVCRAKRGTYFSSLKEAQQKCTGFCCKNGSISETAQSECKSKVRGTYFGSQRTAQEQCKGYCCDEFKVSQTTEKQCRSSRGNYFGSKAEAERFCEKQQGYCCLDGTTKRLSRRECDAKRGTFYPNKSLAERNCKNKTGYCNKDGKTLRLSKDACEKKDGKYFSNQMLLLKDLRQKNSQQPGVGTSKTAVPAGDKRTADPKTNDLRFRPKKLPAPGDSEDTDDSRDNRLPETATTAQRFSFASFGFIHPSAGEAFTQTIPRFSWRGLPTANNYFIRIMKTSGGDAGSHQTIWSMGGITGTNVGYNANGRAVEALEPGTEYRANLYARRAEQTGTPDTDPADYILMTGDVVFTIAPSTLGKTRTKKPGAEIPLRSSPLVLPADKKLPVDTPTETARQTVFPRGSLHRADESMTKLVLPDLAIERIYVDRACRIRMVVSNQGAGRISDEDHARGYFILTSYEPDGGYDAIPAFSLTVSESLPLSHLDPLGQLKHPGGTIDFNSNLVLDRQVRTFGGVDSGDGRLGNQILESEETANNQFWEDLYPVCLSPVPPPKGVNGINPF